MNPYVEDVPRGEWFYHKIRNEKVACRRGTVPEADSSKTIHCTMVSKTGREISIRISRKTLTLGLIPR